MHNALTPPPPPTTITANSYVSADNGTSWTACAGIPSGAGGSATDNPVADRVNPRAFYHVHRGVLYRSADGGRTFTAGASVPAASNFLRAASDRSGHLWLPTATGLYRSTDGGASATRLASFNVVHSVALGQAAPAAAYPTLFVHGEHAAAPGNPAFYRSTDEGSTWTRVNDWAHQVSSVQGASASRRLRVHAALDYMATECARGVRSASRDFLP